MNYEDLYSKLYINGYHCDPYQHHALAEMLPWLVENLTFSSALEIGASKGAAVEWLAVSGKQAVGLEVARTGVEDAQAYGRNVVQGSALCLPFEDGSFDLVWSSDLMEHIAPEDVETAIKEQVRVSRQYVAHQIACWKTAHEKWNSMAGHDLHVSVLKPEEWQERYEAQGLTLLHKSKTKKGRDLLVFTLQTCS